MRTSDDIYTLFRTYCRNLHHRFNIREFIEIIVDFRIKVMHSHEISESQQRYSRTWTHSSSLYYRIIRV